MLSDNFNRLVATCLCVEGAKLSLLPVTQQCNCRRHGWISLKCEGVPIGGCLYVGDDPGLFPIGLGIERYKPFFRQPQEGTVTQVVTMKDFDIAECGLPNNFSATDIL